MISQHFPGVYFWSRIRESNRVFKYPNAYAVDATTWTIQSGIVTGSGNGSYTWKDGVSKEQTTVMLYRVSKLIKTLRLLSKCERNDIITARALHLHRNSLIYRIPRHAGLEAHGKFIFADGGLSGKPPDKRLNVFGNSGGFIPQEYVSSGRTSVSVSAAAIDSIFPPAEGQSGLHVFFSRR